VKKIRHTGIVVVNLKKMRTFYESFFDLRLCSDTVEDAGFIAQLLGNRQTMLRTVKLSAPDGSMVELLKFRGPRKSGKPKNPRQQGITHIAITVDDVDLLFKNMKSKGVSFLSKPLISPDRRARVCFCLDPEGNYLELVEVLKP